MGRLIHMFFARDGQWLTLAREAELQGDLPRAASLFVRAGERTEAARVLIRCGDAEKDAAARIRYYAKAERIAPEDSDVCARARTQRALAVVARASGAPPTELGRAELIRAARELESAGEHEHAAEAYAQAHDADGEMRALMQAGSIDRVDAVLAARDAVDSSARARRSAHAEFDVLVASGLRREAVSLARLSGDSTLIARGREVDGRRVSGGVVRARLRGQALLVILGSEVVVGRAPDGNGKAVGSLALPSAALSRRHLRIARDAQGVFISDLASRNGTLLGGRLVDRPVYMGTGNALQVALGGAVTLSIRPADDLPGAVWIDVGGARYIAPLLPSAPLGVGQWRLETGSDGWVELRTDDDPPPFDRALRLARAVTLLEGDALASARDAAPVLRIQSSGC